ncbi:MULTISPECIES: hypothetical protein [unclassified Methanosarcina]|uniref:hypothetical protein n=1 Tax=unclassified Methanosarcina TaxID=2644672 RepID=UPI0006156C17|nr:MULTISPECIES: hypothetical protein [unclassified Methanosarcina]AKB17334.1 hypothetical protein MSWHS_0471 [Methanosarcina sp. WWM596]AKB20731.1 hypothetical protein MSWH1_0460 [Methanosarcina sp. WH1]
MKQILETLKGKIAENTLTSDDVFAFTERLKESMREGAPIVKNVLPANIDMLEIYAFALQKMEMANAGDSGLRAADWRESIDDFSKLKEFVDKLQESELIKNVAWNVGGMAIYDIPDPSGYKRYVYWNIKAVLDNMGLCELL